MKLFNFKTHFLLILLPIISELILGTSSIPTNPKSIFNGAVDKPRPVILIPGIEASQLDAKLNKTSSSHFYCFKETADYYNIWINVEEFLPAVIECFLENMKLVYNSTSRTTTNCAGVDIKVPDFGGTRAIEYLSANTPIAAFSYFYDLVASFVDRGYKRNETIRGAPYDYRRAPNEHQEYFENLKNLIEETYEMNGKTKPVLICHSMGCLFTLYFLNNAPNAWKDTYIKSVVALGSPWGGSVVALKASITGYNIGVVMYSNKKFVGMERSFPSTAFLLPSTNTWPKTAPLVLTPWRNYSADEYKELYTDINDNESYEMWKDTKSLNYDLKHPGVDMFCIHGLGIPTNDQLSYESKDQFPDSPTFLSGDGDGTVNAISLKGCLRWSNDSSKQFKYHVLPQTGHVDMLRNKQLIDLIYSYVNQ